MPARSIQGDYWWHEEKGHGAPLVLLHGFPLDRRIWTAQLEELSTAARVITPDLPGFGRSRSDKPFTLESLADGLHELLKQLDALPCVLGGLSMGGYVSLAFASKFAADLRGLMIVNSKAEADSPQAKEGRGKMIDLVRTQGSMAVSEAMLPRMLAEKTIADNARLTNFVRSMMNACPPRTIEHALAAMRDRPDRTELLGNLTMPVHFIVGQFDVITAPEVATAMHQKVPQSGLSVIPAAGHLTPLEQPQEVGRIMAEFLVKTPR
jgi:3-oxoadipate enol-lactonase